MRSEFGKLVSRGVGESQIEVWLQSSELAVFKLLRLTGVGFSEDAFHICLTVYSTYNCHHQWRNCTFRVTAFLRRICQACLESDHLVFTSMDFATANFLQSKVVSLASSPKPGGPSLCLYVPKWQGGSLTPQALGPIFVAFYDLQGYGGGIRARLHTENV
jgi:hypothetical protein